MSYDSTRKTTIGGEQKKGGFNPDKKPTGYTGETPSKGATPGQQKDDRLHPQNPKKY